MREETPRPASALKLALSLAPSLAILGSVFFFINSACFARQKPQCAFDDDFATPADASVTFLQPLPDEIFSSEGMQMVRVPVALKATGVEITPSTACRANTGHFVVSIERMGGTKCLNTYYLQPAFLSNGAESVNLTLPGGAYVLKAQVVNGRGRAYQPELSARVSITVAAPVPNLDGGVCP